MDLPVAQYLLFKHGVAGEYRQTPPLYAASFHWAVRGGETGLRDFIQHGFERIGPAELQAIEARWIGNPLTFPVESRYYYYAAASLAALLAVAGLLVAWNSALRGRVRARTARLRELSRRLVEAEESERRNINRELHDRVGQNLSALQLNLGTLQHELAAGAPRVLGARLEDAQSLLATTSRHVRDVMAELRPPGLDEYGLLAALRHHCATVSGRLGIDIAVTGREAEPRLPTATETALFRIAQEALNNVAKHAKARRVSVELECSRLGITLTVADDGVGFDPAIAGAVTPSYGIVAMQERAEAADAQLTIDSVPGHGTRVVVRLETA
jgi:signal transduction histidine kinase